MNNKQEIPFTSIPLQRDGGDEMVLRFDHVPESTPQLLHVDRSLLDQVVIKSNYRGGLSETRNFFQTLRSLLQGYEMYFLEDPTTGARLSIISDTEIPDTSTLHAQMRHAADGSRIPCYLDAETRSLVMCLGDVMLDATVHHGIGANNHRDTYAGVLMTRALGAYTTTHQDHMVIAHPDEISDSSIRSANITMKSGFMIIDLVTDNINPLLRSILNQQHILTFDEYLTLMMRRSAHAGTQELFTMKNGNVDDMFRHIRFVQETFRRSYRKVYSYENHGGVVFAPTTFTDRYVPDDYDRYDSVALGSFSTSAAMVGMLLNDEKVAVSMLLYKSITDKYLLLISTNHPDAFRFGCDIRRGGLAGFHDKHAALVAELDGSISVDVRRLRADIMELESCPLILNITQVKPPNDIFPHSDHVIDAHALGEVIQRLYEHTLSEITIHNATRNKRFVLPW